MGSVDFTMNRERCRSGRTGMLTCIQILRKLQRLRASHQWFITSARPKGQYFHQPYTDMPSDAGWGAQCSHKKAAIFHVCNDILNVQCVHAAYCAEVDATGETMPSHALSSNRALTIDPTSTCEELPTPAHTDSDQRTSPHQSCLAGSDSPSTLASDLKPKAHQATQYTIT